MCILYFGKQWIHSIGRIFIINDSPETNIDCKTNELRLDISWKSSMLIGS